MSMILAMSGSRVLPRLLGPTGDDRHVDARSPDHVGQGPDVLALVGIGHGRAEVVFVLHLHHDDGAAHRDLVPLNHRQNLVVPVLRCLDALRMVGAKREPHGRHPVGKSAALPLRANIGTGPGDHVEAHVVDKLDEVLKLRQVRLAFLRLVVVPEDVGLNGVEARCLELCQTVTPQRLGAARVMKRPAEDDRVFTIDRETARVVADDVRVVELHLGWQR